MDRDGQMAKPLKHGLVKPDQFSITWRSPLIELPASPGEGSSPRQASGGPIRTPGSPTYFDAGF